MTTEFPDGPLLESRVKRFARGVRNDWDGEFDATRLQQTVAETGGSSVCRTGINMTATWPGETFGLDTIETGIKPGRLVELSDGLFTADADGPIRLICCWANGYKDSLYGVTHLAIAEEACRL